MENWQATTDLLAEIAGIPAALIMRVYAREIEVFVSSHSAGNVYRRGEKTVLDTGLFCEAVMSTRRELLVSNALKDPVWDSNPAVKLGMISYFGFPLSWPGGEIFGTLCILDKQENAYSERTRRLMERFRDSIQFNLASIYEASLVRSQRDEWKSALHAGESFSQRYLDTTQTVLLALDRKGYVIMINRAGQELLGYTEAELIGRNWFTTCLPQPENLDAMYPVFLRIMAGELEGVAEYENAVLCRDGSRRLIGWRNSLFRDDRGRIVGALSSGEDITERKRAEAALRESEGRLRTILDTVQAGIVIIDPETHVIADVNSAAAGLIGETRERIVESVCHRYICPAEVGKCPITDLKQTVDRSERVLLKIDGTRIPIIKTVVPIVLGGRQHLLESFVDITGRKQVEQALQESEEKYRRLFQSSRDAIMTLEPPSWKFTSGNAATVELFGVKNEEVFASLTPWDVSPACQPDGRASEEKAREMIATAMREGSHFFEWTQRRISGEEFFATVLLSRVQSAGKEFLQATIRDITAQLAAEERLREQAALLDAASDAICVRTLDHKVTYWNAGAEQLYGWSRAEALGRKVTELGEVDRAAFEAADAALVAHGSWSGELRKVNKAGKEFIVFCRWTLLRDEQGRPKEVLTIHTDITERLKAERLALRSQRLESIGTLAGGVAHDLNNALAPILMSVGLLQVQYPGGSDLLETVEGSAQRAANMVRQLLTFAKGAESQQVSIQPDHLFKEMREIIKGTFPKNIQLEIRCHKAKLPPVLGDPTQLHQVLLNLCVNARDAMPHGGKLVLEAESHEVDAVYASSIPDARPGQYVALRVRDTGTGISPEILDRIFDPFFTTKGPDKGTGLGLATVLGIVKGHGGFVLVYSQPGQGSTFTFYLPADRARSGLEPMAKPAEEFRGQGETVLLVDDEVDVREIGSAVLKKLNFKPVTATDGADGLVRAVQYGADLRAVIVDQHMPIMDGLAFVRALRRILPELPIVVASGWLDETTGKEFKALGVPLHLDKPYTQAMLAETMKSLLLSK